MTKLIYLNQSSYLGG